MPTSRAQVDHYRAHVPARGHLHGRAFGNVTGAPDLLSGEVGVIPVERRDASLGLMRCECATLTELKGAQAERYAEHLTRIDADPDAWIVRYACPETGARWVMDYPAGYLQGGGPPRLQRKSVTN